MHITNQGISLSFGTEELVKLVRAETANQERPRRSYVYGHFDVHGVPFYIGKGTGRRAWSRDRDPLWERYLATRLGGRFEVVILQDDLSSEEAESLESDWIAQESETLINWVNAGGRIDFAALDRYHRLRNKNREAMARARAMERTDLAGAIASYAAALEALAEYANIEHETGLVAQLLKE